MRSSGALWQSYAEAEGLEHVARSSRRFRSSFRPSRSGTLRPTTAAVGRQRTRITACNPTSGPLARAGMSAVTLLRFPNAHSSRDAIVQVRHESQRDNPSHDADLVRMVVVVDDPFVAMGNNVPNFVFDHGISQATMKVGATGRGNREQGAEKEGAIVVRVRVGVFSERRLACQERELKLRGCCRCRIGKRSRDHGVSPATAASTEIEDSLRCVDVGEVRLPPAASRHRRLDGECCRRPAGCIASTSEPLAMPINTASWFRYLRTLSRPLLRSSPRDRRI